VGIFEDEFQFKDSKFTKFSCIIFKLSGRSYLSLRYMFFGCRWWTSLYILNRGTTKRSRTRYIFWTPLWNVEFYLHHIIELYRIHVTLANLCVTRSGTMHLTLSYEVHHSRIVPSGQPKNGGCCMHICFLTRVPPIHNFDNVTPLVFITPISSMWSENSRVMLPKLWMEGTKGRTREHMTTAIPGWV
jgi:hypothetical protein